MIRPGNKLLFVNGSNVRKTHMQEIVGQILGPSGTVVGEPALQFMLFFLRDLILLTFFGTDLTFVQNSPGGGAGASHTCSRIGNRSSSQIPVDLHSGWWGVELQVFQSAEDEKEKDHVDGVLAVALVRALTLPESQEMETARPRLFFRSRGFALTFLTLVCIALVAV
jgi:hypothetical protein